MAKPTYDTSGSAANAVANGNLTIPLTIGNNPNRGLIVIFTTADAVTISSAVWNTSENLTFLNSLSNTANTGKHWIYYLSNPTSGSFNVVITFGTNTRNAGGAFSFYNCNGTLVANFNSATGSSLDPAVTITSTTDDIALGQASNSGVSTTNVADAPATQRWAQSMGSNQIQTGSQSDGQAGSTVLNYSLNNSEAWAAIGCIVKGVGAKPTGPFPTFRPDLP
jgi:hypothetical protein